MKDLILVIILIVGLFIVFKFLKKYKIPKINALSMITGGVKSGKSTFSVYLAISTWKHNVFKVKFKNFFRRLFGKPLQEIPLLYSNVPLGVPYSPLTLDLILRKQRFVYGSVVYIQEASLLADSMLIKNIDINNELLLFNKLIGHETKGGSLIYDTQCISDVHYGIKRSMSNYFYVHHLNKKIPFFIIAYVRELIYSDDGSVMNNSNEDLEESLKKIIIPKSVWKKFDCYCLSTFTDNLPISDKVVESDVKSDLKCYEIVSFRPDFNVKLNDIKNNNFKNKIRESVKNVQENKKQDNK